MPVFTGIFGIRGICNGPKSGIPHIYEIPKPERNFRLFEFCSFLQIFELAVFGIFPRDQTRNLTSGGRIIILRRSLQNGAPVKFLNSGIPVYPFKYYIVLDREFRNFGILGIYKRYTTIVQLFDKHCFGIS